MNLRALASRTVATLFLVASLACHANTLEGTVVAIADGDTITVLDAEKRPYKVRLMGIDAPEKKQPFGARSKQALAGLIFGKSVRVDWQKLDRYGRVLGKVEYRDTALGAADCRGGPCWADAGYAQVWNGMAWHYKQYAHEQNAEDRDSYALAEVRAREYKSGLWADPNPVPPWEWRKARRAR